MRLFGPVGTRGAKWKVIAMTNFPWHPSQGPHPYFVEQWLAEVTAAHFANAPEPSHTETRADCCIARAAYRVVLPVTQTRSQVSELMLCRHHLRESLGTLTDRHAVVFDLEGFLLDTSRDTADNRESVHSKWRLARS